MSVDDKTNFDHALEAVRLAKIFMENQVSACSLTAFINGRSDTNIVWPTYYKFAAGVLDFYMQNSERKYGYGEDISITMVTEFVNRDLKATEKLISQFQEITQERIIGGQQCWNFYFDKERFDEFALSKLMKQDLDT